MSPGMSRTGNPMPILPVKWNEMGLTGRTGISSIHGRRQKGHYFRRPISGRKLPYHGARVMDMVLDQEAPG